MSRDNRAALLRGARICLDRRGYARTRARDVASAAGVSTAAIGYHFGTIDALLIEALLDGLREWSTGLEEDLGNHPDSSGANRLAVVYRCVVESFQGYRGVLAASFELIARADENVEVREQLRTAVDHARHSVTRQVLRAAASESDPDAVVATACYAMISGLIVQWLVDPDSLPSHESVTTELAQHLDGS